MQDFSELEFLSGYDEDWRSKIIMNMDRPSRSTLTSTEGGGRRGQTVVPTDHEKRLFENMSLAFNAENWMVSKGYLV